MTRRSGGVITTYASANSLSAAAGSTQRLLAMLKRGVSNTAILVITDSTGGSVPNLATDRWPYKLAAGLAAMFPIYTVTYRAWSPNQLAGTGTFDATFTDGATTSASPIITSATAAFVQADVGKTITGTGIPAATTILSVQNATTATLSANATATATGVSITITARTGVYDNPVTIQTGTGTGNAGGPFTLSLYNFGVGNSSTDYALGDFDAGVTAVQPQLVFISHGFNEQDGAIESPTQYKGQMLALSESVAAACPKAAIVLICQPPDPSGGTASIAEQAVRANEYQMVAQSRGYGLIDIFQRWIDYGPTWPQDLQQSPTDKHPNPTGQTLWANEVLTAFTYSRQAPQKEQPVSAFLTAGEPLNLNHDFSIWTGAGPDGYRLSGCTASKDSTNYENPDTGYGCRLQATGAAPSYIEQVIPLAPSQTRYRNRPITIAVRMFIPSTVTSTTAGSVQVASAITSSGDPTIFSSNKTARAITIRHGKWVWVVLAHNLTNIVSFVTVRVYADTGNQAGADITLDRIIVVPGIEPRGRSSKTRTALPVTTIADPTAIPAQGFKWEANDVVGQADGSAITQLTDTSGNGRHATQATGTRQATLDKSVHLINGLPTALFSSATGRFYTTSWVQPSQITQYVLYTNRSGDPGGAFIGNANVSTAAQSQDNTAVHLGRNPSNRQMLLPSGMSLNATGDAHLLIMRYNYDDGTYEAWLDGRLIGIRDPGFTVLNPAGAFVIGGWRGQIGDTTLDANVAFVCIASRLHTDPERRGVQDMLASRYALTLQSRA